MVRPPPASKPSRSNSPACPASCPAHPSAAPPARNLKAQCTSPCAGTLLRPRPQHRRLASRTQSERIAGPLHRRHRPARNLIASRCAVLRDWGAGATVAAGGGDGCASASLRSDRDQMDSVALVVWAGGGMSQGLGVLRGVLVLGFLGSSWLISSLGYCFGRLGFGDKWRWLNLGLGVLLAWILI